MGKIIGFGILAFVFLTGLITLAMWGFPQYNVYSARKEGEVLLAHARSSKEVAVQEAKAKMESASMLAAADTIRAQGVATSNKIIGQSLKDNQEYLTWLWVDNMDKTQNQVIYIPTESGVPIMEAGRFKHQ